MSEVSMVQGINNMSLNRPIWDDANSRVLFILGISSGPLLF
jgi:hypothetical protein